MLYDELAHGEREFRRGFHEIIVAMRLSCEIELS